MIAGVQENFDPVGYIDGLRSFFPDMDQWQFPSIGSFTGALNYLHEDDHLFSLPPPQMTSSSSEDFKVFSEFFPDVGYGGYPSDPYSPSAYSSGSSSNHENVFPVEMQPIYSGQQETIYKENVQLAPTTYGSNSPQSLPPPGWIYSPAMYQVFPQDARPSDVMNGPETAHTPPYTPLSYALSYKKPSRSPHSTSSSPPSGQKIRVQKAEEVCNVCKTKESPMWRWNTAGDRECNACNLYFQHNGKKRPPELWKHKILRRRKRNPKQLEEIRNSRSIPY